MSKKHINSISCGQGAPSIFLIVAAGEGLFPADVVITADTGWENDMLWDNGRRTDARTFFEEVTKPLAEEYGMQAFFVRTKDEHGKPYPNLQDVQWPGTEDIPMFGSRGGKLQQSCTSKWKKQGIRQKLRELGAQTATTHLGITIDEVDRIKPNTDVKWETLAWPLVINDKGIKYYRATINEELERRGIPYLVTSECDGCPHKDIHRWNRLSPDTLAELSEFEKRFKGEFFLTRQCIPLIDSIEAMNNGMPENNIFDGCGDGGYCFL